VCACIVAIKKRSWLTYYIPERMKLPQYVGCALVHIIDAEDIDIVLHKSL